MWVIYLTTIKGSRIKRACINTLLNKDHISVKKRPYTEQNIQAEISGYFIWSVDSLRRLPTRKSN